MDEAQLAACSEMKAHCETDYDLITMEDWCDIDRRSYIRKGLVNDAQCFNLESLIQYFEIRLTAHQPLIDPTNRDLLTHDKLVILCGTYILNGNDLPHHLEDYMRPVDALWVAHYSVPDAYGSPIVVSGNLTLMLDYFDENPDMLQGDITQGMDIDEAEDTAVLFYNGGIPFIAAARLAVIIGPNDGRIIIRAERGPEPDQYSELSVTNLDGMEGEDAYIYFNIPYIYE
jgi:hypothetical protein